MLICEDLNLPKISWDPIIETQNVPEVVTMATGNESRIKADSPSEFADLFN